MKFYKSLISNIIEFILGEAKSILMKKCLGKRPPKEDLSIAIRKVYELSQYYLNPLKLILFCNNFGSYTFEKRKRFNRLKCKV